MAMIYTYDGTNSSVNLTPQTYGEMLFLLKQTLKRAGWTIARSSDGITLNASGDQITHAGSGAGGMNNGSAWFVLRQPAVNGITRQLLIARHADIANLPEHIVFYYSYSAGFTGGNATTTPSSADAKIILGASSCSFTTRGAQGSLRFHVAADNAAPYGWYMFAQPVGGGNPPTVWIMDPMLESTYPAADTDPYVFYITGGTPAQVVNPVGAPGFYSNGAGLESTIGATPQCWYKKGLSDETWVYMPMLAYTTSGGICVPGASYPDPFDDTDQTYPILYGRRAGYTTQIGYKGVSSLARWVSVNRNTGDVLSTTGTNSNDKIIVGNLALPWNGSSPLV